MADLATERATSSTSRHPRGSPKHASPLPQCNRRWSALQAQRRRFELEQEASPSHVSGNERRKIRDVDRFMKMVRERGGGNIALAWRRYFDTNGDGVLDFQEFCRALAELKFVGNASQLWIDLGGSMRNSLCLSSLDPQNAEVLETFAQWCLLARGGPMEVFNAIDTDDSDSLTAVEFAEGLQALGFFDAQGLPESIRTPEGVLKQLYPLLDSDGMGCVTPDELLFLERDKEKVARIKKELAHVREHGKWTVAEPPRKDAEKMLHDLCLGATVLGGKHWKSVESPAFSSRGSRRSKPSKRRPTDRETSQLEVSMQPLGEQQPTLGASASMPLLGKVHLPQRTTSGTLLQNIRNSDQFKLQRMKKKGGEEQFSRSQSLALPSIKEESREKPAFGATFSRMVSPYQRKHSLTMLPGL